MSFMKKVAKVALPILGIAAAPFTGGASLLGSVLGGMGVSGAGAIASGIGLGAGVGSSLLGGSGGKKGKMSSAEQQLLQLQARQQGLAEELYKTGKPLIDQGAAQMTQSLGDYRSLISGGPAADKLLARPMFDLTNGYQQALKQTVAVAPRGNSASAFADQKRSLARDMSLLKADQVNTGLLGAERVGTNLANLGVTTARGAQAGLSDAGASLQGAGNLALGNRQISSNNSAGLGQGLGSLLGVLLGPGGLLNKGGGGGNSGGLIIQNLARQRSLAALDT